MIAGIYQIRNLENDKVYIGSTKYLARRRSAHFTQLEKGTNRCGMLQRVYDKYGKDKLVFEVLITCHPDMLLFYEQQFLDQWNPEYNISKTASSGKGTKRSEEFKERIRQANLGKTFSQSSLEKMRQAKVGGTLSQEHKDKIKASMKNHWSKLKEKER